MVTRRELQIAGVPRASTKRDVIVENHGVSVAQARPKGRNRISGWAAATATPCPAGAGLRVNPKDPSISGIPKAHNTQSGLILGLLSDSITRAIVERLLVADGATPTELHAHVCESFTIALSGVSTRLEKLEIARLITRDDVVRLEPAGRQELERIVQAARRLAFHLADEVSESERAEHALMQRRLNAADKSDEWVETRVAEQQPLVVKVVNLLDDVAAKTDWQRAAADEPSEAPEATLQRRTRDERPDDWPAFVWVSQREHSRSPKDLVDVPARYLPAPARQLIISIDWHGFAELIDKWSLRYEGQLSSALTRWAIPGQLRLLVEQVLAPAIVDRERREPPAPELLADDALLEVVQGELPSIETKLREALREAWGRPPARATRPDGWSA